jgi:predicted nucleotidyltransferase
MSVIYNPQLNRHEQAELAAKQCERILKESFGAREVYLFGSLSGQSPWHSQSDIDLAVEGLAAGQYIQALTACYELLPAGMELDLVTLETAPPELIAKAKREVGISRDAAEDSIGALKDEIAIEMLNLRRLVDECQALLAGLSAAPSSVELRAFGSIIHDFYTACERIFERVAVYLGHGQPTGDNSHITPLRLMELNIEGGRPAVLDHEFAVRLHEYLRFRHLFRHTYGYELDWENLQPLVERLEMTKTELGQQLNKFILELTSGKN